MYIVRAYIGSQQETETKRTVVEDYLLREYGGFTRIMGFGGDKNYVGTTIIYELWTVQEPSPEQTTQLSGYIRRVYKMRQVPILVTTGSMR